MQPIDSTIESFCYSQCHYKNWASSNFVEFRSGKNQSLISISMSGCFKHNPQKVKINYLELVTPQVKHALPWFLGFIKGKQGKITLY